MHKILSLSGLCGLCGKITVIAAMTNFAKKAKLRASAVYMAKFF